jgi:hypothetical protein
MSDQTKEGFEVLLAFGEALGVKREYRRSSRDRTGGRATAEERC